MLHRERTVEVGIDRSHLLLHRLVLGQELHAADGFLHRLRPVVQQVPRRVLHPCHSRVHDTFAGYLCPETPARRAGNLKTRKEAPRHQPAAHCRHRPDAPGSIGSGYVPAQEAQMLQNAVNQQMIPANELSGILANLGEMRAELVSSDALRSFIIIGIGCSLLWLYASGKLRSSLTIAGITILCLADMWGVNKRYLNDAQFVPHSIRTETFTKTNTDELILQDTSLDYRVLNFATSTFDDNNTSYWHKSVGGYHPAKLRRYQEMIEHHISPEMQAAYKAIATAGGEMDSVDANKFRVLNMLNTKYFIFPAGQQRQTVPILNPHAYGNAWFVNKVQYVNNANEEIDALDSIIPTETAVVDARFKDVLKGATESYKDSLSSIRLTSYTPNRLTYETNNAQDGIAVFSEIYYPDGWHVTIDGQPAELARADYILRTMHVPAGQHTIEMRFDPTSLHVTEGIAYGALALLVIGIIVAVLIAKRKYVKA